MAQTQKILVILRHENSLRIVHDYLETKDMQSICIALDPVELPGDVDTALHKIKSAIQSGIDAVIIGTKVYDSVKRDKSEPPARLIEFLNLLKNHGIDQTPICMTHLSSMSDDLIQNIKNTGLKITWVENDNLKSDQMTNLGPLLLAALK